MSLLILFIEYFENCSVINLKSFVSGRNKDIEAVENAVASSLNNGLLEGINSRLKMIKRMICFKF
ncbi:transposase [Anaerocolumna sp. MB42-C2]|uniref:transposase n=1 Tax=Anaerocolumna sp. MB42-C2 TaxID=3070997 RepID=UPI003FA4BECF